MLGYTLLVLTLLFYVGLISINITQPRMSGEGGMGYGLALFVFGLGFTLCSLFLTLCVVWQNGFDWVLVASAGRNILIGFGWLCMAAATFASAAFKWEWHEGEFPQYLRWLAVNHGLIWIPLLMLIPYFFLLNAEIRASVSPNVYKIPLIIGFSLTTLMGLGLLFGWFKASAQQQKTRIESRQSDDSRIHDEHLKQISEQKPTDAIVNLMPFTGRFHDEDVRSAALAKVKEKPDWENQLIALLENEYYHTETYTFLDGNKVEHPEKFLEPLNRSILRLADDIYKRIKDTNNLQDWHFEHFGIERLLRAIDEQFYDKGMDFRPAVLKLQKALNTTPPERFKNVHFTVTPVVNDWLKKHK
jgi:hypothetical protein